MGGTMKIEVLGEFRVSNHIQTAQDYNRLRAFKRAGLDVETWARRKAPYDTGRLRRNIVSEATEKYAEIGVDLNVVPYAWYQEAGTSRMQAHPYLRPALASRRPAIIAIFKDEINKAIKKGA